MIKIESRVANPKEVPVTLSITMTVVQWEFLESQIADKHPGWVLKAAIRKAIRPAIACLTDSLENLGQE